MDIEISRYGASKQQRQQTKYEGTQPQGYLNRNTRGLQSQEQEKQHRRTSESSSAISDTIQRKNKVFRKKKTAKKSSDTAVKRELDDQENLSEKWHQIVDEYGDRFLEKSKSDEKRVSKSSHTESSNNLTSAFGVKGYHIPVRAVSSTERGHDGGISDSATSVDSWGRFQKNKTPTQVTSRKSRRDMTRNSQASKLSKRSSTASSRPNSDISINKRSKSEASHRQPMGEIMRYNTTPPIIIHPDEYTHGSRGQKVTKASTRQSKVVETKQYTSSAGNQPRRTPTPSSLKKQKVRSNREKSIEGRAANIVEEVIDKALDFLYLSPRSKRRKNIQSSKPGISTKGQIRNQHTNLQTSREANNTMMYRSNVSNAVAKKQKIRYLTADQNRHHDSDTTLRKALYTSNMKRSITPTPGMGGYVYGYDLNRRTVQSPPPYAFDHHGLSHRLRASSDVMSESSSYNPRIKVSSPSSLRLEDDLSQRGFDHGSNYSTTLEIRDRSHQFQDSGRFERTNSLPRKIQPPTLTKGTVTRFLHQVDPPQPLRKYADEATHDSILEDYYTHGNYTIAQLEDDQDRSYSTLPASYKYKTGPKDQMDLREDHMPHPRMHLESSHSSSSPPAISLSPRQDKGQVNLLVNTDNLMMPGPTYQTSGNFETMKRNFNLSTVAEDEGGHTAFSNEPMIVADLIQQSKRYGEVDHTDSQNYVVGNGKSKIYGTQPDLCMRSNQTMNFFVFNQQKPGSSVSRYDSYRIKQETSPKQRSVTSVSRLNDQSQTLDFDEVDLTQEYDTEYTQYLIHHKGTQTASPRAPNHQIIERKAYHETSTPRMIRKETQQKTVAQQLRSTPDRNDYTKYPAKDMSCQTDLIEEETSDHEREFYSEETFHQPITLITNEINRRDVTQHMPTYNQQRNIPIEIQGQRKQEETVMKEIATVESTAVTEHEEEKEEESEEEVIETIEVEEREQRIAMAIFEELEFNAQRTQGGRTVSQIGSSSLEESTDIPAFWVPDKYEAVVDRRRQKMTQVKDITKSGEDAIWRGDRSRLALTDNTGELGARMAALMPGVVLKPKVISDTSVQSSIVVTVLDGEDDFEKSSGGQQKGLTLGSKEEMKQGEKKVWLSRSHSRSSTPETSMQRSTHLKTEYKSETNTLPSNKFGILKRSNIALPEVSTHNVYQDDNDTLPENLENFEQMVTSMEEEVLHSPSDNRSYEVTKSTSKSKQMYPSKFLPENVSFGRKSGEELLREAEEFTPAEHNDRDRNRTYEKRTKIKMTTRKQSGQNEPLIETKVYKDPDGNFVKVTEMNPSFSDNHKSGQFRKKSSSISEDLLLDTEQLGGASYIDMNLFESQLSESGTPSPTKEIKWEQENSVTDPGGEVTEETTIGIKPNMKEVQESSMNVKDDEDASLGDTLSYEVKTSASPSKKFEGIEAMDKYETMSTEL